MRRTCPGIASTDRRWTVTGGDTIEWRRERPWGSERRLGLLHPERPSEVDDQLVGTARWRSVGA